LAQVGSISSQIGNFNDAEECYAIYTSFIERVYGQNSLMAGQTYFWLGHFYTENEIVEKAKLCFLKTAAIFEAYFGTHDSRVADCHFNLALVLKQSMMLLPA
jgi:hypothetical protein